MTDKTIKNFAGTIVKISDNLVKTMAKNKNKTVLIISHKIFVYTSLMIVIPKRSSPSK